MANWINGGEYDYFQLGVLVDARRLYVAGDEPRNVADKVVEEAEPGRLTLASEQDDVLKLVSDEWDYVIGGS
jgi:hypothetical protein